MNHIPIYNTTKQLWISNISTMLLPYEIERNILEFLGVNYFKRCRARTKNKHVCKKKAKKGYFFCPIHQNQINKKIQQITCIQPNYSKSIGELCIKMHYIINHYYSYSRFTHSKIYI